MSSYTPIIGAFASFFELSVALNFAYAASANLQALVKTGFLNDARRLSDKFAKSIESVKSRIQILYEDVLLEGEKEDILAEMHELLADLKNDHEILNATIEDKQKVTSKQNKPLYIYIAVTSLFMLYYAGVETVDLVFSTSEIFTMLSLIIIFLMGMIMKMLLTDTAVSVLLSAVILIGIIVFSYCFPYEIDPLKTLGMTKNSFDALLLNTSLLLAFFPFIYTVVHFFVSSYWVTIKFQYEIYKAKKELNNILGILKAAQKKTVFFKKLRASNQPNGSDTTT